MVFLFCNVNHLPVPPLSVGQVHVSLECLRQNVAAFEFCRLFKYCLIDSTACYLLIHLNTIVIQPSCVLMS